MKRRATTVILAGLGAAGHPEVLAALLLNTVAVQQQLTRLGERSLEIFCCNSRTLLSLEKKP